MVDMNYFAYGSNMSQGRLEDRVGAVKRLGRHRLLGYKQTFTKEGLDKSGKGNIETCQGSLVYGVAYLLKADQFEKLRTFESGYDVCNVVVIGNDGDECEVFTFMAKEIIKGLQPTSDYWQHYLKGMNENDMPDDYIQELKTRAGLQEQ